MKICRTGLCHNMMTGPARSQDSAYTLINHPIKWNPAVFKTPGSGKNPATKTNLLFGFYFSDN